MRAPGHHELPAFCQCIEEGFGFRFTDAERERFLFGLSGKRLLAAFVGGSLVGTLVSEPVPQTVPGPCEVVSAAITEAAVLPAHRRRGNFTAVMSAFLAQAHERGEVLAVLSASEGGLYERFGFGVGTWSARYSIDPSRALVPGDPEPGRVEPADQLRARRAIPPVFEALRKSRPGEVSRTRDAFDELFAPHPHGGAPTAKRAFALSLGAGGGVDGYAVYDLSHRAGTRRGGHLSVVELVSASPSAYRKLWAYLLGIGGVERVVTAEMPVDEPLRHLLSDPRAVTVANLTDRTWLRLIEIRAALSRRRYFMSGSIVLEVFDDAAPWNTGRYLLSVDALGRGTVEVTTAAPDLRLGAAELGALYLGGSTVDALAAAGRIEGGARGGLERAGALFYTPGAPFCSTDL